MPLNITRGRILQGLKFIIFGPEGVGKTTLASQFPRAVFLDMEDGTKHYDVSRLPTPTSWAMFLAILQDVIINFVEVGTLVIDTADAMERLCIQAICEKAGKSGIEDFGYAEWAEQRGIV